VISAATPPDRLTACLAMFSCYSLPFLDTLVEVDVRALRLLVVLVYALGPFSDTGEEF
jgi:hypothetical protein